MNDNYLQTDLAEYERRVEQLRQTPGCTCQVITRNMGTLVSEMWTESYGCLLHDEQRHDFEDRQAALAAIPGCLCQVQAVNIGTRYYRAEEVTNIHCPVHGEE